MNERKWWKFQPGWRSFLKWIGIYLLVQFIVGFVGSLMGIPSNIHAVLAATLLFWIILAANVRWAQRSRTTMLLFIGIGVVGSALLVGLMIMATIGTLAMRNRTSSQSLQTTFSQSLQTSTTLWGFRNSVVEQPSLGAVVWGPTLKTCELLRAAIKREAQEAKVEGITEVVGICQPVVVTAGGSWWGVTIPTLGPGYGRAENSKDMCDLHRTVNPNASQCAPVTVSMK
jgi:hypothetical protein